MSTPRPERLRAPLAAGAGKLAAGIRALGIGSIGDLLEHLPRDRREMRSVRSLRAGEPATIVVQVRSIRTRSARRRGVRSLVHASVFDESGSVGATFFNQPWLARRYPPGTRLLLHGKLDTRGSLRVWSHALDSEPGTARPGFAGEPAAPCEGSAIAHYQVAEGVSSTQLASLLRASRPALAEIAEVLPAPLRARERLPERAAALAAVHFAEDREEAELGRRRLAFEELLLSQLLLLRRRSRRRARRRAPMIAGGRLPGATRLEHRLPFALTADQRAAIRAIDNDLGREHPMQRLLVGEVGSGKTVVALHAMLRAAEHGHQAALMAPTETLAEQHFQTLANLLGGVPVSIELLTSSTSATRRRKLLSELRDGRLSIAVGTHALIERDVVFRSLAVAVVDEQHRFGVRQRVALGENDAEANAATDAHAPHVLHMTATPIPRTLALASFGDLDVSTLRELPARRGAVDTRIVAGAAARQRAYRSLRAQLEAGRQGYIVCPLVSEPGATGSRCDAAAPAGAQDAAGDTLYAAGDLGPSAPCELRAAEAELRRLRASELDGFGVVLLHGQMPARERRAVMSAFVAGEAHVLVSTTVIEVGIDVPNATVMIVENAERFGISQLHQLRGRIGRGEHRSECSLMTPSRTRSSPRLRALAETSDGFKLAELDLQLRGRGELAGMRQSGPASFRVARLPEDATLLENARSYAEAIIARDPELRAPEHALLQGALAENFGAEALAPIRA